MRPPAFLVVLALAAAPAAADAAPARERPALTIAEGSVARRQVVAIGRDLVVAGDAEADVAAIDSTVEIAGRVAGDVIVLGGDVTLGAGSRVGGDVFVLGGHLETMPGARIGGRAVSYPSIRSTWLVLLEGPTLGLAPLSGLVIGAKLALLAGWAVWTLLVFATSGREVLATSEAVGSEPFRCFFLGLTGVLALFLTALFLTAMAASVAGAPLLALTVLAAVVLKLWGLAAVFHATGAWFLGLLRRRRWRPINVAIVGLLVLGALKIMPWVGVWAWTAASLIGVGATLSTKFGRREPWIEPAAPPLALS